MTKQQQEEEGEYRFGCADCAGWRGFYDIESYYVGICDTEKSDHFQHMVGCSHPVCKVFRHLVHDLPKE